MASWCFPGMKPPFTVGHNYGVSYSVPNEVRLERTYRWNVEKEFGRRSLKLKVQLPLHLHGQFSRFQLLPCTSTDKAREGQGKIVRLETEPTASFSTCHRASLDDFENQESIHMESSKPKDQELSSPKPRFAPFWSKLGLPSRGRSMMKNAFGGGYERELVHEEVVRRLNSVGGADRSQSFLIRSTTENDSFRSRNFEHGVNQDIGLEDEGYCQLGSNRYNRESAIADFLAMKRRRVPLKEHDLQNQWARRSILNHCIPAILEKLGFNDLLKDFSSNRELNNISNVNVSVSYKMRYQLDAADGSQFLDQSRTGKGYNKQDGRLHLLTTDSIRQMAKPMNFLTSSKGGKVSGMRKGVGRLEYADSSSFGPNPHAESQVNVPYARRSTRGRRQSAQGLWLQAGGDSAPTSIWRDLFTIIGLTAFIICGTYAFAMSHRYLKFGSKDKPPVTMGTKCPDPHSAPVTKSSVIELSSCNFEPAVSKKATFVLFYAPWCSHCQQLEHIWRELAIRLPKKGYDVQLAQMDAEKYASLAEKFKVVKYPTLIFFKDGKPTDSHSGPRDVDSLMTFIDENYV